VRRALRRRDGADERAVFAAAQAVEKKSVGKDARVFRQTGGVGRRLQKEPPPVILSPTFQTAGASIVLQPRGSVC
jgi:hypothetical protein